jgi:hypothetical protein
MSRHSALPWPVLELLDDELNEPIEVPAQAVAPMPAEAVFMASCDVFLTRDGSDTFTLTLKHRGQVSEIRLRAALDESGAPSLLALVA